jgi:hypothetical protein
MLNVCLMRKRKLHQAGSKDVLIVFRVHVLILQMAQRKGGSLRLRFMSRGSVHGKLHFAIRVREI